MNTDDHRTYQATWHGTVLAESDRTIKVEGNRYFPPDSINRAVLRNSTYSTICPWKGTALYYSVSVDGTTNDDAAWFYPHPTPAAAGIRDYVAFWKGVRVAKTTATPVGRSSDSRRKLTRLFRARHS